MIIRLSEGRKLIVKQQIFPILVIWVFSLGYYLQIRDLSFEACLFPYILLSGIVIFGLAIFWKSFEIVGNSQDMTIRSSVFPKRSLMFALGSAVAITLFNNTVAVISIVPATYMLLYITGVRSFKALCFISISLTVFVWLFFEKWLMVRLPNVFV